MKWSRKQVCVLIHTPLLWLTQGMYIRTYVCTYVCTYVLFLYLCVYILPYSIMCTFVCMSLIMLLVIDLFFVPKSLFSTIMGRPNIWEAILFCIIPTHVVHPAVLHSEVNPYSPRYCIVYCMGYSMGYSMGYYMVYCMGYSMGCSMGYTYVRTYTQGIFHCLSIFIYHVTIVF